MLFETTEGKSFFSRHPESLVWQSGDRWGRLSCFASSVISHSCSHRCARWDTLKWNSIGLITYQGSLGAYLTCLSRDKRFCSKSSSFQTDGSYLPALGFSVFSSCGGVCVYVCTWNGKASDIGKPDHNNAIKFSIGIACFAWAFSYAAD